MGLYAHLLNIKWQNCFGDILLDSVQSLPVIGEEKSHFKPHYSRASCSQSEGRFRDRNGTICSFDVPICSGENALATADLEGEKESQFIVVSEDRTVDMEELEADQIERLTWRRRKQLDKDNPKQEWGLLLGS